MSRHDPLVGVRQMLDHVLEAMELARSRDTDDLASDRLFELALTHLVEIVGEAANRVPADLQARHPEIPWSLVVAMRHRLAHGYDRVDRTSLWKTVEEDFPPLVAPLERILKA